MFDSSLLDLVYNIAILLAIALVFEISALRSLQRGASGRTLQGLLYQGVFGLVVGAGGMIIMSTPWVFMPGIIFDTRSILIAISGLFFGSIPTLIGMGITAAFRIYQGGSGAVMGVSVILASGVIGIFWRRWTRKPLDELSPWNLLLFGFIVHAVMLALTQTLPRDTAMVVLARIGLPVLLIYPAGTALIGSFMVSRLRRQNIAREMQESNERLRLAVAASKIGFFVIDLKSNRSYYSDEWKYQLGYAPHEIGESEEEWSGRVHPDDLQTVLDNYHDYLAGRRPDYEIIFRLRHKDGSYRWIQSRGVIMMDESGKPDHMLGCHIDITAFTTAEEELKKSEQQYRLLTENIKDVVWIMDVETMTFKYVSPSVLRLRGYTPEEVLAQPVPAALTPAGSEAMVRRIQENMDMITSGQLPADNYFIEEVEQPCKDGTTVWTEAVVSLYINPETGRVEVRGVSRDISDRRRVEEASRIKSRSIETAINAVVFANMEGQLTDVNPSFLRMWGYGEESEVIGCPVQSFWQVPGEAVEVMGVIERSGSWTGEMTALRRDGTTFIAQVSTSLVLDDAGQAICRQASFADITGLKMTQEALRTSEENYRRLIENANDIIYSLTPEGVFTYVSPSWTNILGHPVKEVVNQPFLDFLHPEDIAACANLIEALVGKGEKLTGVEYRVRHKDGSWRWHSGNASPIYGADGTLVSLSGIARDITERKQAEDKSHADHLEQQRLLEETRLSRRALLSVIEDQKKAESEKELIQNQLIQAQKMESVGRLAGGMAHDFNNLLSVIMGHAETAMDKISPQQSGFQDLEEILTAAERSADLIRQLLAFSRKQIINPRILDMNSTIANMLKMLQRLIGEDIELVWQPGANLKPVLIDPSQVDQVLVNLLVNARDAIAGVGKIIIETDAVFMDEDAAAHYEGLVPGEYTLLTVNDNGSGMSADTIAHLFEPFFTTKEVGKGTGLGLATTFGIIKQNKGNIYVFSKHGEGTTFKIYLPTCEGREAVPFPKLKTPPSSMKGTETILIVEDEEELLQLCLDALEGWGYTVLASTAITEALKLAREHAGAIDLLISDVIMPEMNGKELARQVTDLQPGLKCLFMSGYTADIIGEHGILGEGIHFIQKPFLLRDLSEKVRQVLKKE